MLFANGNEGIDAVHFEAEMIDALLEMVALYLPFGSDGNDREVDMTVGQIGRRPHALDDLETKRIRAMKRPLRIGLAGPGSAGPD